MQIDALIELLKDYVKKSDVSEDKKIYKSYQTEYLDGIGGVIINSFDNKFEIYTYIKNKDKIASPLLYWKTDKEESAIKYYNILVNIIDSQDYNVLKGFCISGL
ncbi:MAG: hypothetical protein Q4E75_01820 [bacterium]|nr:hypothetical protein [bacterium]